ncbi:MAG TPA: PEGA domain-containing protein, partial [Thermoanaerobaculia bacterium]|nr:PEGA domain-containing protein [Thermoanaerobaculia bacterium]
EAPLERERPPQPSPEPAPLESAAAAATPEPAELSPTPAEAFALEGAARAPAGMGSVLVNAMPYGFVRIDGKEYGATAVRVALAPGPHLVEVFRKGYRTEARNVAVGADRERVEAFLLDVDGEAQEE